MENQRVAFNSGDDQKKNNRYSRRPSFSNNKNYLSQEEGGLKLFSPTTGITSVNEYDHNKSDDSCNLSDGETESELSKPIAKEALSHANKKSKRSKRKEQALLNYLIQH